MEKPRAATASLGGLSVARRGIAMSVSASRMACGIVALKRGFRRFGVDGAVKTSYELLARSKSLGNRLDFSSNSRVSEGCARAYRWNVPIWNGDNERRDA